MTSTFDLDAFKAFVAGKPRDEVYDSMDTRACAVFQFFTSRGVDPWDDPAADRARWDLEWDLMEQLHAAPYTFGALADRLAAISKATPNV